MFILFEIIEDRIIFFDHKTTLFRFLFKFERPRRKFLQRADSSFIKQTFEFFNPNRLFIKTRSHSEGIVQLHENYTSERTLGDLTPPTSKDNLRHSSPIPTTRSSSWKFRESEMAPNFHSSERDVHENVRSNVRLIVQSHKCLLRNP